MTLVCGTVGTNPGTTACKKNRLHIDIDTPSSISVESRPLHRINLIYEITETQELPVSFLSALSEGVAQPPYEARARVVIIPATPAQSGQTVVFLSQLVIKYHSLIHRL